MSKQEFSRLEVLLRVQSGRLRISDACVLIGLQRRQLFRLLRGLKQEGATGLVSKRRGKPSNHRLPAEVRTLALSVVRERYADFGPTLAAEKLAEHHGCSISRETLRGWALLALNIDIICANSPQAKGRIERAFGTLQALRPDDAAPGRDAAGPRVGAQAGGSRELPGRAVRGSVQ